jgi:hypothetical protein
MTKLMIVGVLAMTACGGGQKTAPPPSPVAETPSCQGHLANAQCYPDLAAACAALACEAPNECISLESFPPQAECRVPPT